MVAPAVARFGGKTIVLLLIGAGACSYDYDAFQFASGASASSSTGGAGLSGAGAAGGLGGFGGVGQGGVTTAGSGGLGSGGGGGVGGLGGQGSGGGCASGLKPCGAECVSVDDPSFGCEAVSCSPCALANATPVCSGGACAIASCNAGFGDCDAQAQNGCEIDLLSHSEHCGACNRPCAGGNTASIACAGGLCVSTCNAGYGNCTTPAAPAADDGCELSVTQNSSSCGGCGNACSLQGNVASGKPLVCGGGGSPPGHCGCFSGKRCRIGNATGSCDAATGHCKCGGQICAEGEECVQAGPASLCSCNGSATCLAGTSCCQTPNGCFDLSTDAANCSACGHACPSGFACISGACACTADVDCNAGTMGSHSCQGGRCVCDGSACATAERCQPSGGCG